MCLMNDLLEAVEGAATVAAVAPSQLLKCVESRRKSRTSATGVSLLSQLPSAAKLCRVEELCSMADVLSYCRMVLHYQCGPGHERRLAVNLGHDGPMPPDEFSNSQPTFH